MDKLELLDKVKTLLRFNQNRASSAEIAILEVMIDVMIQQLLGRLKGQYKAVPQELAYIIIESVIIRYNRMENEGMSNFSSESVSYAFSHDNALDSYDADIKGFLSRGTGAVCWR